MSSSIGQKLRQTRDEQGRTLDEISIVTRIKLHYLQAMEADEFDILPSMVQQRGFLRSYAKVLGLDPEYLVSWLEKGTAPSPEEQETDVQEPDTEPQPEEENEGGVLENIGDQLKAQRNILGFTIKNIEQQTHIKPRYLKALEEGRFDDLPSPVQGRGMLKNYALFLGLDPDPLLLKFAEDTQDRLETKRSSKGTQTLSSETEIKEPQLGKHLFSQHLIVSGLFALVLFTVLIWASGYVFGEKSEAPKPTASIPSVAEVLLPSFTPSPTATFTITPQTGIEINIEEPTATSVEKEAENTPLPTEEGEIQIQLAIVQRTWVRVIVDGEEKFNGRMLPGSIHVFAGDEQIELLTGNAAGIILSHNQQELGVLGIYGGVVNLIFTRDGILDPTPTVTPTPTITPTFTITPTPRD